MFFQEISRFCAAYPPDGQLFPVLFQGPVDSGGAYGQELFPNFRGNVEGRPCLEEGPLVPDTGCQKFPTPVPEEGSHKAEGLDDLWPIDRLPPAPLPPFHRTRFEFDGLVLPGEEDFLPPVGQNMQGLFANIAGGLDKLVQDFGF
jgi:hypothetical protein